MLSIRKRAVIVTLPALLALLLLSCFQFSPRADEAVSFDSFENGNKQDVATKSHGKLYTDDEYGFNFTYPETFEVSLLSGHGTKWGVFIYRPWYENKASDPEAIVIYFPENTNVGFNPTAIKLEDYKTSYVTIENGFDELSGLKVAHELRINSQLELVINGVPALKQSYSVGFWTENKFGERYFDTSPGIPNIHNHVRYVFFDGLGQFIIIDTMRNNPTQAALKTLDVIAQSFRFI